MPPPFSMSSYLSTRSPLGCSRDVGDAALDVVGAHRLRLLVELVVALARGPDVHVVDSHVGQRQGAHEQLVLLDGVHAAEARAQRVAHRLVARPGAQDVGDPVRHLAVTRAQDRVERPGGRQQAVHLHPGDHVLEAAEAVLGLEVGGEQLEAGRHDDRADLDLVLLVARVEVDAAVDRARGDALGALRAHGAVQAAPRGLAGLRLAERRLHLAEVGWRRDQGRCPRTRGVAASRSSGAPAPAPCRRPAAGRRSRRACRRSSQRSIMCAARRPSPTARVMSVGPLTTSPAAKMKGVAVWQVAGSATRRPRGLVASPPAKALVSAVIPIALTMISHGSVNSLPGMGSGLRRPEASGAPSAIRVQRSPLTAPFSSPSDLGRGDLEAEHDAFLLGVVGLDVVGGHLVPATPVGDGHATRRRGGARFARRPWRRCRRRRRPRGGRRRPAARRA